MREYRIGEIIRKRRIELGLTQGELCEGIYEEPTMSRIEMVNKLHHEQS